MTVEFPIRKLDQRRFNSLRQTLTGKLKTGRKIEGGKLPNLNFATSREIHPLEEITFRVKMHGYVEGSQYGCRLYNVTDELT